MVSFRLRPFLAVTALVVLSTFAIQKPAYAQNGEGFTGADLMRWSESGRFGYLDNVIGMMAVVFAQAETGYGACIGDWYFKDVSSQMIARQEIENVLARFPNHDPRGAIIALVQRECGEMPLQYGD